MKGRTRWAAWAIGILALLPTGQAQADTPRDTLTATEQRRRDLAQERTALQKEIKAKDAEIKKAQKPLDKLRQTQAASGYTEHTQRIAWLHADIAQKQERLAQRTAQRDSLTQLSDSLTAQINEWEGTKADLAQTFIAQNEAILNTSLSTVQVSQLNQLLRDCKQYEGDDSVARFGEAVQALVTCKQWYDTTTDALTNGCDKNKAEALRNQLKPATTKLLRATPRSDVGNRKNELSDFLKGIAALKTFLREFDEITPLESGIEEGALKDKCHNLTNGTPLGREMETYVHPNAYLNGLFEQFKQQRKLRKDTDAGRTINNL